MIVEYKTLRQSKWQTPNLLALLSLSHQNGGNRALLSVSLWPYPNNGFLLYLIAIVRADRFPLSYC